MAEPSMGLSGVEKTAERAACRKSIAEWGTMKGWAKAWKAEPQVICQGAMYVNTKLSFSSNSHSCGKEGEFV